MDYSRGLLVAESKDLTATNLLAIVTLGIKELRHYYLWSVSSVLVIVRIIHPTIAISVASVVPIPSVIVSVVIVVVATVTAGLRSTIGIARIWRH